MRLVARLGDSDTRPLLLVLSLRRSHHLRQLKALESLLRQELAERAGHGVLQCRSVHICPPCIVAPSRDL